MQRQFKFIRKKPGKKRSFRVDRYPQPPTRWYFYRMGDEWILEDHTGYERSVGQTLFDAMVSIKIILNNYGYGANLPGYGANLP